MSVMVNGRKLKTFDDVLGDFPWTPEEKAEMELNVELACKLIEAREQKGISQRELAKMSGLKQPAIARLEKLEATPKINTMNRVLIPLGYKLDIVPLNQ